tara:strand:- start:156 stop:953 length:798 start_codon:yes stop_codon:yes gene_type:complete
MRILVTTSDQYLHLLTPHAILFNKYWPNQDVTILGFDDSNIPKLPDNFSYVSLGKQSDYGRYWTNPLIPYVNNIEEEYFVVMMGDFLITGPVDIEKFRLLEDEIVSGNAEKALLDTHLSAYTTEYKSGIRKIVQGAPYRTTLHPAIWKKEYFKRYLKPDYTVWDFEIKNMPESQADGATILLPEYPSGIESPDPAQMMLAAAPNNVIKAANVYVKGVPFPRWDSNLPWGAAAGIRKEDILLIYDYINPDFRPHLESILEDGKIYK